MPSAARASASGPLLLDVAGRRWSDEVLDALDIDRAWLPRLLESPEVSGMTPDGVPGYEDGLCGDLCEYDPEGAQALLDEWEPRAEALHKWLSESGGKAIVRCNVTSTDGSMPAMILPPNLLGRLYSLGVELDIDMIAGAPE